MIASRAITAAIVTCSVVAAAYGGVISRGTGTPVSGRELFNGQQLLTTPIEEKIHLNGLYYFNGVRRTLVSFPAGNWKEQFQLAFAGKDSVGNTALILEGRSDTIGGIGFTGGPFKVYRSIKKPVADGTDSKKTPTGKKSDSPVESTDEKSNENSANTEKDTTAEKTKDNSAEAEKDASKNEAKAKKKKTGRNDIAKTKKGGPSTKNPRGGSSMAEPGVDLYSTLRSSMWEPAAVWNADTGFAEGNSRVMFKKGEYLMIIILAEAGDIADQ
jgi:hypothetical protein